MLGKMKKYNEDANLITGSVFRYYVVEKSNNNLFYFMLFTLLVFKEISQPNFSCFFVSPLWL